MSGAKVMAAAALAAARLCGRAGTPVAAAAAATTAAVEEVGGGGRAAAPSPPSSSFSSLRERRERRALAAGAAGAEEGVAPAETDCFFGGETLAAGSTRRLPRGDADVSRVEEAGAAAASLSPASFLAATSVVVDVGIVASGFLSPPSPRDLTVVAWASVDFAPASCVVLGGEKERQLDEKRQVREGERSARCRISNGNIEIGDSRIATDRSSLRSVSVSQPALMNVSTPPRDRKEWEEDRRETRRAPYERTFPIKAAASPAIDVGPARRLAVP